MKVVVNKFNISKVYTLQEFEKLTLSKKEFLNQRICCPECYADAYYSEKRSNNRRGFFGAKHKNSCSFASKNQRSIKK